MDMLKGALGGKKAAGGAASSAGGALGGALGGLGGLGGNNPLLSALLPMLMGGGGGLGGLGGLLSKFQGAGLGQKANSWVGTGANEEISPDEVHQALGQETIDDLAQKSGLPHDQVKGGLAKMLPGLVDQLSPGGSMPGADQLGGLMKNLNLSKILGQ
jgi:uncharacterized protein YidB (DUF937 family)